MKIIVTGALGHIGSKLIRELKGEIILIDNLYSKAYYSLFSLNGNYKFIHGDILDLDLASIFKGADVVIHLAAITDAENSYEMKEEVYRVNFDGTKNVMQACIKADVSLIFASTTSVYGVQEDEVDETCDILKPQSPYAESKIASEQWIKHIGSYGYPEYAIIRMGTIFGTSPGMRFHTAINKFCFQASIGQPITVWKTAMNQNRPYLSLDDAVQAINFIIENKLFEKQVYNLVTVNTTVANIIDIIHHKIPNLSIKYVETRIMSQLSYTISNKKFRNLGFEFKGDLSLGINETLDLLKGVQCPVA